MQEKTLPDNELIRKTVASLRRNNMSVWFLPGREEALEHVMSLIPEGSSIGLGDSATVEERDFWILFARRVNRAGIACLTAIARGLQKRMWKMRA